MIFYGSALRGVSRCGRNKRQVAVLIEATSVAGAPVACLLRNFVPGDGRGAWQRLAVRARVAVHRTIMGWDGPIMLRRARQTPQKRI